MFIITALNVEGLDTEHRFSFSKCYSVKWDLMVNQEGDFYRYVDTNWRLLCAHHPRSRRRGKSYRILARLLREITLK